MAEVDIQGSLAHADMLESIGIISSEDKISIEKGMARILEEIRSGAFVWSLDLEDVHLNIEKRLVELIGRSEEHTSELQSLMRISYAVFCLKKKQQVLRNQNL